MLLSPNPLSLPPPDVCLGRLPDPASSLFQFLTALSPHRIICPPGRHLSLSQHTKVLLSLNHNMLSPHLLRSCHACRIPDAITLPMTKYLLASQLVTSETSFAATMDHSASSLPRSLSPYLRPQVPASTPPVPPLSPVACQFTSPVSAFPLL